MLPENEFNSKEKNQILKEDIGKKSQMKKTHGGIFKFFMGLISGFFVTLILVLVLVGLLSKHGLLHVSSNGQVVVQDVDDSQGIGNVVEKKLNALDSVLDAFYMEDVDEQKAQEAIYKAYLDSYGDKYTEYYTADEYKKLTETTSGQFYGIGAVCTKNDDGTVEILEVYDDSPAMKAGIKKGDSIEKVDDNDIRDTELSVAVSMIKGDINTEVKLGIISDGVEKEVTAVRDKIDIVSVSYKMLEDKIGYIYVSEFQENTPAQFKKAIDDLNTQGMQGMIVDIRDNPGGLLSSVVEMADYILPDGLIVYTEDKNENKKEYKGSDGHELDIPITVLVNQNSASASEIFSGAMQDYGYGTIVGTKTYGKGIVQVIRSLTDGSAVKFTISKYFTPNGQDIHGRGIIPDIGVDLTENDTEDVQFNAALSKVKEMLTNN